MASAASGTEGRAHSFGRNASKVASGVLLAPTIIATGVGAAAVWYFENQAAQQSEFSRVFAGATFLQPMPRTPNSYERTPDGKPVVLRVTGFQNVYNPDAQPDSINFTTSPTLSPDGSSTQVSLTPEQAQQQIRAVIAVEAPTVSDPANGEWNARHNLQENTQLGNYDSVAYAAVELDAQGNVVLDSQGNPVPLQLVKSNTMQAFYTGADQINVEPMQAKVAQVRVVRFSSGSTEDRNAAAAQAYQREFAQTPTTPFIPDIRRSRLT